LDSSISSKLFFLNPFLNPFQAGPLIIEIDETLTDESLGQSDETNSLTSHPLESLILPQKSSQRILIEELPDEQHNTKTDTSKIENRVSRDDSYLLTEDSRASTENSALTTDDARLLTEVANESTVDCQMPSEDTRVSTEDSRVSSEDSRVSTEDDRASREDTRVFTEDSRASSEDTRVSSEDTRVSTEDSRVSPKDSRVSPDNFRHSTEDGDLGISIDTIHKLAEQVGSTVIAREPLNIEQKLNEFKQNTAIDFEDIDD
jgi:hypothetical protein